MDKFIKFVCLLLVLTVTVQFVQIEKQKEKERENWRVHRFIMDTAPAYAFVDVNNLKSLPYFLPRSGPIFVAGAALANSGTVSTALAVAPHVLGAVVLGGAIVGATWAVSVGMQQMYMNLQAKKNGMLVDRNELMRDIAERNGIDTTPANPMYYDGPLPPLGARPGVVFGSGASKRKLGSLIEFNESYYQVPAGGVVSNVQYSPLAGCPVSMWVDVYTPTSVINKFRRSRYCVEIATPEDIAAAQNAPSGFNPADHPHLYQGQALLNNCRAAYNANPNAYDVIVDDVKTSAPAAGTTLAPPDTKFVGRREDGNWVDSKGRVWPAISSELSALLPLVDSNSAAEVEIADKVSTGTNATAVVTVHKTLKDKLHLAGIHGAIEEVGSDYIQWKGEYGNPVKTYVSPELAAQAANSLNPSLPGGQDKPSVVGKNDPEPDPGTPANVDLPDTPNLETDVDWGQEKSWPWAEWLSNLPFLGFLRGSSIQLQGAQSTLSFDYNLLGKTGVMRVNFAQYESILNGIGVIIYACACFYALQLALIKRD